MTKDSWIKQLNLRASEHLIRAEIAHSEGDYRLQLEECKKAEECFNLRDALVQTPSVENNSSQ